MQLEKQQQQKKKCTEWDYKHSANKKKKKRSMYDTPLSQNDEQENSKDSIYKQPLSFNWKLWIVVGLVSLIVFVAMYWIMNAFVFSSKTTILVVSPRPTMRPVAKARLPTAPQDPRGIHPLAARTPAAPPPNRIEQLIQSNWGKINSALQEV